MPLLWLLYVLAGGGDPSQPLTLEQQYQAINLADAQKWEMYLDQGRTTKAQLIERPIYTWTNPTKGQGQHGSVFVWTHRARPMVVGSVFVDRSRNNQRMVHEFHAVAPDVLHPHCLDSEGWEPTAGITLQPLEGAPQPESSPAKRLLQIRAITRDFGGHAFDEWRKLRWELRSLPQPLYRYQSTEDDILDGALMALVTDAGTDPDVLLLLEAGRGKEWQYALLRFSDCSLYVQYQGRQIWSAVRGEEEQPSHNANHTYQVLRMRLVDPSEIQIPH